jgi:hypothetical protein
MDHGRERDTGDKSVLVPSTKISRRTMVAGTVATTAVAVLPLYNSAFAQAALPDDLKQDMMAFLILSVALTGVDIHTLAPEFTRGDKGLLNADPGVDPFNIKQDYFDQLSGPGTAASFAKLLKIVKDNPLLSQDDIIAKVNASEDDTRFLARSVVLLWYLGSWYDPVDLKNAATSPESIDGPIRQKVLSPKAYTQGLVWLISGAHPMGYSNLQFGYWSHIPLDHNGNPVQLFSPAQPLR